MQSQQVRDDKTLAIASSLGLGLVVAVAGGLALWGVRTLLDPSDATLGALGCVVAVAACTVIVARLARVGRSEQTR